MNRERVDPCAEVSTRPNLWEAMFPGWKGPSALPDVAESARWIRCDQGIGGGRCMIGPVERAGARSVRFPHDLMLASKMLRRRSSSGQLAWR